MSLIFLFSKFNYVTASSDDEEENFVVEIIGEIILGAAISICESYATCNYIMTIFVLFTVMIVLIGLCMGDIECADICNRRTARRTLTIGTGYSIGRRLRR